MITERNEDSTITANDIHACRRLKKVEGEINPNVIVRMDNRKNNVDILSSKRKLKEKAIDLGPETKTIHNQASQLKKKGLLNACWTYNGVVNIKISKNSRPKKIFYMSCYESSFDNKKQLE